MGWLFELHNTNLGFREFGVALFFAAVGLDAGAKFFRHRLPLTTLQRILSTQVLAIVLFR